MFTGIERYKIASNIHLYMTRAEHFKTNSVGIYFERALKESEASKNALLSSVLRRGTRKYPESRDMYRALENLYGAVFSTTVSKFGERQILKFQMQFPDAKYIGEPAIFEKSVAMLNEIVNHPHVFQGAFPGNYFVQERENQIARIENKLNNKMAWAFDRCIEEMFKGEPFAVNNDGKREFLEALDESSLYDHYRRVMESSRIDIFIVAKEDRRQYSEKILKAFEFRNRASVPLKRERHLYTPGPPRETGDALEVSQGKLVMGLRTNVPYESELYRPLLVFNEILGGGSYSKLFRNIREKESLCYSIFSSVEKFKSALFVASGIDFNQKEKVQGLVMEEIEKLKRGEFTEMDLENAKRSILSSIDAIKDSPNKIMNFHYSQILTDSYLDSEEIKTLFNAVDRQSVVEAAQGVFLDTVYFLNKGGRNHA